MVVETKSTMLIHKTLGEQQISKNLELTTIHKKEQIVQITSIYSR